MKKACPKAAELNFPFQCPLSPPDCKKCTMFGGSPLIETFVKLPEKPGQTDAGTMTREQCEAITRLIIDGHNFKKTGNQAYAMRAIVEALKVGLYPPLWAIQSIGKVFEKFLKPTTHRGIANLFGCGPGKNIVKEMLNQDKREWILQRINREYAKGLSLEDAVAVVENEDGKQPGAYDHIAKDKLAPEIRLDRAFNKSRKNNPPPAIEMTSPPKPDRNSGQAAYEAGRKSESTKK